MAEADSANQVRAPAATVVTDGGETVCESFTMTESTDVFPSFAWVVHDEAGIKEALAENAFQAANSAQAALEAGEPLRFSFKFDDGAGVSREGEGFALIPELSVNPALVTGKGVASQSELSVFRPAAWDKGTIADFKFAQETDSVAGAVLEVLSEVRESHNLDPGDTSPEDQAMVAENDRLWPRVVRLLEDSKATTKIQGLSGLASAESGRFKEWLMTALMAGGKGFFANMGVIASELHFYWRPPAGEVPEGQFVTFDGVMETGGSTTGHVRVLERLRTSGGLGDALPLSRVAVDGFRPDAAFKMTRSERNLAAWPKGATNLLRTEVIGVPSYLPSLILPKSKAASESAVLDALRAEVAAEDTTDDARAIAELLERHAKLTWWKRVRDSSRVFITCDLDLAWRPGYKYDVKITGGASFTGLLREARHSIGGGSTNTTLQFSHVTYD